MSNVTVALTHEQCNLVARIADIAIKQEGLAIAPACIQLLQVIERAAQEATDNRPQEEQ